jgi:putative heme-binding domain-containing protein
VIRATHPAFRPIDVKMGPDGAIYVADWYNPIIQHGEVDFRDPRRDVTRGRIWRITAKGRDLVKKPDLVKASPKELCEQLKSPEGWTRHFARRVLKEQHAKSAPAALAAFVANLDSKPAAQARDSSHKLEALWAYQTLDVPEPKLLASLLSDTDARVRAAAVRVVAGWHDRLENALALLEPCVSDDHPQVRLEAVRALALLDSAKAAEVALRVADKPLDENLDYALWLTMRELESKWLPTLAEGKFDFGGNVRRVAFALQAVGSAKVVPTLAKLIREGKLGAGEVDALALLAEIGSTNELALVFEKAMTATGTARTRLLSALEKSARERKLTPKAKLDPIADLIGSDEIATRLAGLWKLESARAKLVAAADKDDLAAIDALALLGGGPSANTLSALIAKKAPLAVRRQALIGLTNLNLGQAAKLAVGVLSESKDGSGASEIFDAFLGRKGGAELLSKALVGEKLPADVARVGVRSVRILGRPTGNLEETLRKAGDIATKKTPTPEEIKALVADLDKGDAKRGEAVYRRADMLCLKCHAIGGAGGQVGPDMSSIGAAAQADYLVESLLLPSKAIKENYHSTLVTTGAGRQYTGIKVRQTPTTLVLRNDQDQEVSIPLSEVEEQTPSKLSLMPEGLTDTLTRGEFLDLVKFLTSLGKVEPYLVGNRKIARRWQVLVPTEEVFTLLNRRGMTALVSEEGLTREPVYTTVAGMLPVGTLPKIRVVKSDMSIIRTQIEAKTAGKATLVLNSAKGVSAFLGGEPIIVGEKTVVELRAGVQTLTLVVRREERGEDVSVEIEDTAATAGVRFVGGK